MNEGIIQKVFKRFIESDNIREHTFCLDSDDLIVLQQELIIEIKKELSFIDDREVSNTDRLELLGEIWTKLIGDIE